MHPVKKSVIVHREVGEHTETFAAALKSAMRHDPDILLVGEMRGAGDDQARARLRL